MGFLRDNVHIHRYEGDRSIDRIDVTEKRAPTDESIRILREMEKEVIDRVVDRFNVQDNKLNVGGIVMRDAFPEYGLDIHVKFTINGHEYRCKVHTGSEKIRFKQQAEELVMAIAERIAGEIVSTNLDAIADILLEKEEK